MMNAALTVEQLRQTMESYVASARVSGRQPTRDELWSLADRYCYPKPPSSGTHRPMVEHLISAVLETRAS